MPQSLKYLNITTGFQCSSTKVSTAVQCELLSDKNPSQCPEVEVIKGDCTVPGIDDEELEDPTDPDFIPASSDQQSRTITRFVHL